MRAHAHITFLCSSLLLFSLSGLCLWRSAALEQSGAELLWSASEAADRFIESFGEAEQREEFSLLDARRSALLAGGRYRAAADLLALGGTLALAASWLSRQLTSPTFSPRPPPTRQNRSPRLTAAIAASIVAAPRRIRWRARRRHGPVYRRTEADAHLR